MTFDQTTILWCLAVPAAIAAVACLAGRWIVRGPAGLIASAGWWLAVAAALVGLQGFQWWPEDAWRQAIWPLLAWVLLISSTSLTVETCSSTETRSSIWVGGRWVAAGLLAIGTALIAMPSGEAWADTYALHRIWLPLVAASCLVNSFALETLSKRGGHRWSLLVALAGLGGPMAMAAATYGSLAQWTLAMIVATAVSAAVAMFSRFESAIWSAATPATVGAAGVAAAGRFYSWETYPTWLYAAVLFLPAVVVLIDSPLRPHKTWIRVLVSGLASAALVGVAVWRLLLS